ncbi:MAG: type III-B CRISPR module RAMP protein Cmr4 [Bacteroidales bacterium]|nr:type III-B CRISPR module RAMP protein Cmr4 [Bacteroidales bacterium]
MTHPEFNYDVAAFLITAKSNLHAGAGGENYWIIDNLIQRDPATNLPCIYSTSLKGALREFFRHILLEQKQDDWFEMLFHIFGNDRSDIPDEEDDHEKYRKYREELEKDRNTKVQIPGKFRFLQADIITLPVRSDRRMFYRVTSPYLIENFRERIRLFGRKTTDDEKLKSLQNFDFGNTKIGHTDPDQDKPVQFEEEDLNGTYSEYLSRNIVTQLLGKEGIAIARDEVFCELADDYHLPVIARNHLEDGTSTNLWYEQVLPRESRLFFMVLYPKGDPYFESFSRAMLEHPVQIGANASVGYGICSVEKIELSTIKDQEQ